jgi:hypothetical protein
MATLGGTVPMPIRHRGPLIDVTVNRPGSQLAGIKVQGLIDTGSDFVLFSPTIARRLELRHINDDVVGGIGGQDANATIYSGCLEVPDLEFEKILPLYAVHWGPTSHMVLLGRSFLRYFVFKYDGPSEVFHFSRPLDGEYHPAEDDG